jgi:quinol monooxygenase YgiN
MKFSRRQFLHLAASVVALPAVSRIANAQTEPDRYFYATSYIEVVPASEAEALHILKQLADAGRRERGVLNFEIAQMVLPTNHFVIFGAWKDQQAYDAHLAAAYTKQGGAALASQLLAPVDTQLGKQLVRQDLQAPPAGAIYGITHFAILPDRVDDFRAALLKYTEATRQAVGNLRYFPAQDTSRPNHFSVVEMWKDQASEDAYEAAGPSKEFRASWAPITGPHYDRRWYKAL